MAMLYHNGTAIGEARDMTIVRDSHSETSRPPPCIREGTVSFVAELSARQARAWRKAVEADPWRRTRPRRKQHDKRRIG